MKVHGYSALDFPNKEMDFDTDVSMDMAGQQTEVGMAVYPTDNTLMLHN